MLESMLASMGLTPHDLMMMVLWPAATAALNGLITLMGASEHPMAKVLAAVGTSLLSSKKK